MSRLRTLNADLEGFKATDSASWTLARIFNALLAEAQKAHADDPVLSTIEPAEQAGMAGNGSTLNIGTMRAAIGQMLAVLDPIL